MLHSYTFTNFQSFRDRTCVDLTINRKVPLTDWMAESATGERCSKLMAVVGPNGSGKTALLKPLVFASWFVGHSFNTPPDAGIPVASHAAATNDPVEIEVVFDFAGKVWRYVLRCTPQRVVHEALYQKRERFGYLFVRDWDDEGNNYRVKQQDLGLSAQEARRVRQNVSLLSWAAQFDVPLAVQMTTIGLFSNVNVFGRMPMGNQAVFTAAKHFFDRPAQRKQMEQLLSEWDLGLTGVELQEVTLNNPQEPNQKLWVPIGQHKCTSGPFSLPFSLESSGTQSAFVLLSRLLQALEVGGVAVIDEFESDLHPHMLEPILDLFANPASNPHQAQLLFSCHALEVLNLIHKSQVMLVEKNECCESQAVRMDGVSGIRNDDNYYAKYMAGAYGAVPVF